MAAGDHGGNAAQQGGVHGADLVRDAATRHHQCAHASRSDRHEGAVTGQRPAERGLIRRGRNVGRGEDCCRPAARQGQWLEEAAGIGPIDLVQHAAVEHHLVRESAVGKPVGRVRRGDGHVLDRAGQGLAGKGQCPRRDGREAQGLAVCMRAAGRACRTDARDLAIGTTAGGPAACARAGRSP